MKKKLWTLLVSVIMITICLAVPASADEVGDVLPIEGTPRYEIDCPGGAKHDMLANGVAYIYSGTVNNPGQQLVYGFAWRCNNCGMMLGTEGSPLRSGVIGKYAINDCYYTNTVAQFYGGIDGAFYGNLKTDPYWKMFSFRVGF